MESVAAVSGAGEARGELPFAVCLQSCIPHIFHTALQVAMGFKLDGPAFAGDVSSENGCNVAWAWLHGAPWGEV